jgi:SAM-dependent methyltransferase
MSLAAAILEHPLVYRLWQSPFAAGKLAPVLAHNDLERVRRVLDVGCGPGTNTAHFARAEYLGIDINPRYIAWAGQRYGRTFVAADITSYRLPDDERFDFVLVNSFLHHLSDEETGRILAAVARTLAPDGFVHILELVLPEERSLARWLADRDRGKFARPLGEWRRLFARTFEIVLFEPYSVGLPGLSMWNMVYCKGRAKA